MDISKAFFTSCPFWGQGGQYTADPVTGARTRVNHAAATATPAPALVAGTNVPAAPVPPLPQAVAVKNAQE